MDGIRNNNPARQLKSSPKSEVYSWKTNKCCIPVVVVVAAVVATLYYEQYYVVCM